MYGENFFFSTLLSCGILRGVKKEELEWIGEIWRFWGLSLENKKDRNYKISQFKPNSRKQENLFLENPNRLISPSIS